MLLPDSCRSRPLSVARCRSSLAGYKRLQDEESVVSKRSGKGLLLVGKQDEDISPREQVTALYDICTAEADPDNPDPLHRIVKNYAIKAMEREHAP